jgi:hypothetical protein
MSWDNLVDTWLNLATFAFIGVLLWLYMKKDPNMKKDPTDETSERG